MAANLTNAEIKREYDWVIPKSIRLLSSPALPTQHLAMDRFSIALVRISSYYICNCNRTRNWTLIILIKYCIALQKCNTKVICQEMVFCVGVLKNLSKKNKLNKINGKGNWPSLNLVMVLGNKMDVQHTHRWQNRDVAFLMDFCPFEKKSGRREGGDIVENKVCIWLCRFLAETGRILRLQWDFTSIVISLDQCWNQTSPRGIKS